MFDIDFYILDVMLLDIDGFVIVCCICEQDIYILILFFIVKLLKEDWLKGLCLGVDDYIIKLFSIEEFMFKVEIFLRCSQILLLDNVLEYVLG